MIKFFKRFWNYLTAGANQKFNEKADPKIQLEQAITEAQEQHRRLKEHAANVIAQQKQTELQLNRAIEHLGKLNGNARQAVKMADDAAKAGDAAKAAEYTRAAETIATQLVEVEAQVEDLKTMHFSATQASDQAKSAVASNGQLLQKKLAERQKLLSQLEQAKMQEQVSASLRSMSEIAAPGNTPSLEEVREKIERRYATAMGEAELAQSSVQGRMLEVQQASVQMAGHSRLEQIRASMRGDALPSGESAATPATAAPSAVPEEPLSQ